MQQYRLYAYDINTNTPLCEIPVTGSLSFGRRLNSAGPIQFDVSLANAVISAGRSAQVADLIAPVLSYNGVPFKVYVDQDGVIVGSYIVWTGNYQKSKGTLTFAGTELVSYYGLRAILADFNATTYPSGVDPAILLRDVLNATHAASAGADIGLTIVNASTGMPTITAGYDAAQHTMVKSIMSDITGLLEPGVGGIDITLTSQWAAGVPVDTLRLVTPRTGGIGTASGVIFDLDSCLDFTWPTDATAMGTTITVTGTTGSGVTPTSVVSSPSVVVGGLGGSPRLDKVLSTSSTSQAQVDLAAQGYARQYGKPVITPTVTLAANDPVQPFGTWDIGDDVRLYSNGNERFPSGYSGIWRVVADDVTIPAEGVPTVVVTLNAPPVY